MFSCLETVNKSLKLLRSKILFFNTITHCIPGFLSQGFCLSFLTQLDRSSHPAVQSLIRQHLLGHVNAASLLKQPLPVPQGSGQFCNFEGFWIAVGNNEPVVSPEYVLTASVKANLKDLSRVVSARYVAFVSAFSAFIKGHIPQHTLYM